MSYLDDNLVPGEQVVYRARLHWILYRWAIIIGLIFLGTIPMAVAEQKMKGALSWLGLTLVVAGWGYVLRAVSEFGVTNKRVMATFAFNSLELLLTKVETISVEQPILGTILGYGNIIIVGTGGTRHYFKRIDAPHELRKHVNEQIAAAAAPSAAAC